MATIETKLRPWQTPSFATVDRGPGNRGEGLKQAETIPISELPASTVREMAQEWLEEVYRKANIPVDWRFD